MLRHGARRGRHNPYALVLILRILLSIINLPRKPPITIALIGGMAMVHFRPDLWSYVLPASRGSFPWEWFTEADLIQRVCMHPRAMLESLLRSGTFDFHRLVVSALVHGDDLHLYYNMASFLLKGYSLEFDLGPQAYATLLAFSLITSQSLLFLSSWALMVLGYDGAMNTCTVGFSGVIFSLKYVLARRSPSVTEVMGFRVHTRYATWLELVLIAIMVPNSSFLGHLCGIIAGILYVELPKLPWLWRLIPALPWGRRPRRSYTYRRGTTGRRARHDDAGPGDAGASYAPPPPSPGGASFSEERDLQEAMRRSLLDAGIAGHAGGLDDGAYARDAAAGSDERGFPGEVGRGASSAPRESERYDDTAPSAPSYEEVYGLDPPAHSEESLRRSGRAEAASAPDAEELRRRRVQRFG